MPLLTNPFLSTTSFRRPIRSITTKRMALRRGNDHRLLSRAQLVLVTTLTALLKKYQGILATTLLLSRPPLTISLHWVKLSPSPAMISSLFRPFCHRVGRRKQPMLERYTITILKRAKRSGTDPSRKTLRSKFHKLTARSPLTNLSTLRRSPK